MLDRKQRGIHLLAPLECITPVDEEHGALHQHDGDAGRAGEAGQPRKPLLASRHIFILMAIGARHDEAGQAAPCEFRAQRRNTRSARRTLGSILE